LCVVEIVWQIYPIMDRTVSARQFWMYRNSAPVTCSAETNRSWRYSLSYYANRDLPVCQSPNRQ